MAIRINNGAVPHAGRITMPKGTYLPDSPFSQPSTAADGGIGGGAGMNPGMVGTPVGGNPFLPGGEGEATWKAATNQPNPFQGIMDWFKNATALSPQGADKLMQPNAARAYKNMLALATPQISAQSAFTAPKTPKNELVGSDISSSPGFVTDRQVVSMFGDVSAEQRAQLMAQKGYQQTYQAGVGAVWVKVAEGTSTQPNRSATSGGLDERGRPEFVDPTALEPGERVTAQSGITFVGGTPYTNPAGTTVAQYAMTIPGGANDTKGRFKWKSTVQKDDAGNWVRIYRKELRKVYTRSHRKKLYGRREDQQSAPQDVSNEEVSQLVNFRANFG